MAIVSRGLGIAIAVTCGFWSACVNAQDCGYEPAECGEAFATQNQRRGTLFNWGNPLASGGPDLSAPLVTDRPDFTEASSTVGLGVAQLEAGYTYFQDDDGPNEFVGHSFPESLLRLGIYDDWLELRVGWNYSVAEFNSFRSSGATDLYLGFKIGLTPQDGWKPEMALIPQMTVPTGASSLTADRILPGANLIYGWELTDTISMAGSSQFNAALDGTGTYSEFAQSWTFAFSLSDKVGAYTEWFGIFPESGVGPDSESYFNGGFTLLTSDDVQWDVRAGTGLNDYSADFFAGIGISIRFQ